MRLLASLLSLTLTLTLSLGAVPALAAPAAPKHAPSPTPSPALSESDLEDINKALGLDSSAAPEASAPDDGGTGVPVGGARMFQSMNPDISFILDAAGAYFTDANPLQAGGHDPRKTGFNFQQLEMSLHSYVDPYFVFNGNIVFAQFGVEVEEAYATTTSLPYNLQARAGQFLTRFGRLNATHPHSWDFVDQPIILGKFMGGEGNRGLGTELSWLAPLPWYAEVVGSVTEAQGQSTARSFYGATDLGVKSPLDLQATTSLQQFFPLSRDLALNWGLSAATGPNPTGRANRSDLFGTDLYLRYRPLEAGSFTIVTWTTELMARRRQLPGDLLADWGGYSSLFWQLDQNWGTALRYELGTGVANDPLDPDWTAQRQRVSANVTFWPSEFSRFRLQQSVDLPGWRPEPIYATMLTYEFVTGAHGAHHF